MMSASPFHLDVLVDNRESYALLRMGLKSPLFGWLLFLSACGPNPESADPAPPAPPSMMTDWSIEGRSDERMTAPDFTRASESETFKAAAHDFARLVGSEGKPADRLPGGICFDVRNDMVERHLESWHRQYIVRGVFVFRRENHFNIGKEPDKIVLLPTTDKYSVILAVGTDGANYDIDTAKIILWLRNMERDHPFTLLGAGMDFLEGRFDRPPRNAAQLAQRMYKFCPDIVDQGTGDIPTLESEIKKGRLYFWWD